MTTSGNERLGNILILGGLLVGVVGAILTVALGEIWPLLLILVGISDMGVGVLFRSGTIGRPANREP